MKDYLISMFIDNELDLDEKIEFVETVHDEPLFKDETVELLRQEKTLHGKMVHRLPQPSIPLEERATQSFLTPWLRPAALFATGIALGAAALFMRPTPTPLELPTPAMSREVPHRFVIYRPDIQQARLIGNFTRWQPVSMHKVGSSGYWSITFSLPNGEYQYNFLLENGEKITDPTVSERVQDDFGGQNSIISVEV
ncbi:MAG: glycogen-binding domain-containing protein [Thermodesulfobacteriota bacterium]